MNPSSADLQVCIRKMTAADIERVSEIDQISFSLPWPKHSFEYEIQKNAASRAWVAENAVHAEEPVIVGMIVTWLLVDELHIATLAVDPACRQHQIGLRLIVHALCSAVTEGAKVSYLEVRRGNTAARSLYQKLGYVEDNVRLRYYQDNHEDAILMSLSNIDTQRLKSLA